MGEGIDIVTMLWHTKGTVKPKLQVTKKEILSSTGISHWTFVWYRREGLLPAPLRHEALRGKGSISFYPAWIIDRIKEIEALRKKGLTVAQVKGGIKWRVAERLRATLEGSFEGEDGEEVVPVYPLTVSEVLQQIAKQATFGYLGYLVEHYHVKLRREGSTFSWEITMKTSEPDIQEPDSARRPSKRKENEHAD